ncbi:hypothetical protein ACFXTN_038296 [Malus domestica]
MPCSSSARLLAAFVIRFLLRSSLLETDFDPTRIMTMIKLQMQKMNTELEAACVINSSVEPSIVKVCERERFKSKLVWMEEGWGWKALVMCRR